jgi:hypothetical protein
MAADAAAGAPSATATAPLAAAHQAAALLAAEERAGDALDVARASIAVGALQDALLSGQGLEDDLQVRG